MVPNRTYIGCNLLTILGAHFIEHERLHRRFEFSMAYDLHFDTQLLQGIFKEHHTAAQASPLHVSLRVDIYAVCN